MPRLSFSASLATVASLALALPALAQTAGAQGQTGQTPQAMATQTGPVSIVSARDLTGHSIRDTRGERLGEIRYVLVRLEGEVAGVAVRPEDGADPELLVVPWRSLDFGFVENEIRVSTQQAKLRDAPRFSSDELAQLTQPAAWTAVTEYWAPLEAVAGGTGAAAAAQQAARPSGQADQQPQQAAGPGTGTGAAQAGAAGEQQEGLILVGRNIVTTMATPAFRFTEQLRGADVVTTQGQQVGEIDEVAIDPRSGQVAFVTIREGGTLGFGANWYAVPIETLSWTDEEDQILLTADRQKLQEIESLDASRTPMRVQQSQLASLYQRFGVQPYWEARQQARGMQGQQTQPAAQPRQGGAQAAPQQPAQPAQPGGTQSPPQQGM